MIKILRNPNFSNWFDIRLFGELIDNAKSQAKALQIAKKVYGENNLQIRDLYATIGTFYIQKGWPEKLYLDLA